MIYHCYQTCIQLSSASFTDAPNNAKLRIVNFGVSQPILYLLRILIVCKGWAEDLPPTQHMGTESLESSQWTPVKNMKRDASYMQESSDFHELSTSQKRVKLMDETTIAEKGFSDHSAPPISSPDVTVNETRNISALQSSPSGSQPFFRYYVF